MEYYMDWDPVAGRLVRRRRWIDWAYLGQVGLALAVGAVVGTVVALAEIAAGVC